MEYEDDVADKLKTAIDAVFNGEPNLLADQIKQEALEGDSSNLLVALSILSHIPYLSLDALGAVTTAVVEVLHKCYKTGTHCKICGSKRQQVTQERREMLTAISKLPRFKEPIKTIQVLQTLKAVPQSFAIEDLPKINKSVNINSAREVVRLLSKMAELKHNGTRDSGGWTKTDKFGKSELWELLTSPGKVKITLIRKKLAEKEKKPESKTSIILRRIKEQPSEFRTEEIIKDDTSLSVLAGRMTWLLRKDGDLESHKGHRNSFWTKTKSFGKSPVWEKLQNPAKVSNE